MPKSQYGYVRPLAFWIVVDMSKDMDFDITKPQVIQCAWMFKNCQFFGKKMLWILIWYVGIFLISKKRYFILLEMCFSCF